MSLFPPNKILNQALVEERHNQLVLAATELFFENGFHKTTVRQISAATGWQMGTLYLYISKKEDVLFLISKRIMGELSESLLNVTPTATAVGDLKVAMSSFFDAVNRMRKEVALLYRESPSLFPNHLEELKNSELFEREFFATIVRDGIERGEFLNIDVDLFCHDVIMLAHMWALKGWDLAKNYDFDTFKEVQIKLLLRQLIRE